MTETTFTSIHDLRGDELAAECRRLGMTGDQWQELRARMARAADVRNARLNAPINTRVAGYVNPRSAVEWVTECTAVQKPEQVRHDVDDEGIPSCMTHGTRLFEFANGAVAACPDCLREDQRAARVWQALDTAGIGSRLRGSSFSWRPAGTPAIQNAYTAASARIKAFVEAVAEDREPERQGLILCGFRGTGKTSLLVASLVLLAEIGTRAKFAHVNQLLDGIANAAVRDERRIPKHKAIDLWLRGVRVALLNELGVKLEEKASPAQRETVFLLIDRLWENRVPFIITTNMSSDKIASAAWNDDAQRTWDRIRDMAAFVPMDWPSLRGGGA